MKISIKQYAELLFELVNEKSNEVVAENTQKFASIVFKNNDKAKFSRIIEKFGEIWDNEKGIINASVTCGERLDEVLIGEIKNFIKLKTKANSINIEERIDKDEVLGGIIIKYKDKVIDACLRTRINNLKAEFIK
ncbi:F0F1 ATP synthase subunit delta [Patescibacteria group bacterium]|nr:F0F1 ATP synthase subunit delta [Patescibacteria group bacterium]